MEEGKEGNYEDQCQRRKLLLLINFKVEIRANVSFTVAGGGQTPRGGGHQRGKRGVQKESQGGGIEEGGRGDGRGKEGGGGAGGRSQSGLSGHEHDHAAAAVGFFFSPSHVYVFSSIPVGLMGIIAKQDETFQTDLPP